MKGWVEIVKNLCELSGICLPQEHWLYKEEVDYLNTISKDCIAVVVSSINVTNSSLVDPIRSCYIVQKRTGAPCTVVEKG